MERLYVDKTPVPNVVIAVHDDKAIIPASTYILPQPPPAEGQQPPTDIQAPPTSDIRIIPYSGDPPIAVGDAPPTETPEILKAYAADLRWRAVNATITITVTSGPTLSVVINDDSQVKIAQLKQGFDNGTLTTINYRDATGAIYPLDATDMTDVYQATVNHVQVCHDYEKQAYDGIDGGTVTTYDQVDAFFASVMPQYM